MPNSTTNLKLKKLLKNNSETKTFKTQNNIDFCRNKMNAVCRSLSKPSQSYKPKITVVSICGYMSEKNKIQRILYSEISNYIFSLDVEGRGIFATNIESLLQYVLKDEFSCENATKEDCQKIVIKIYDHFQLALNQVENSKNILCNGVEDLKETLKKENKGIEREYITILAVFSSIVVTFIGGISFSNDVLKNIDKASIYRLLITIDALGFILTNVIYMMIHLIFEINDKEMKYSIKWTNLFFGIAAIAIVILWSFSAHTLPNYFVDVLPGIISN